MIRIHCQHPDPSLKWPANFVFRPHVGDVVEAIGSNTRARVTEVRHGVVDAAERKFAPAVRVVLETISAES